MATDEYMQRKYAKHFWNIDKWSSLDEDHRGLTMKAAVVEVYVQPWATCGWHYSLFYLSLYIDFLKYIKAN